MDKKIVFKIIIILNLLLISGWAINTIAEGFISSTSGSVIDAHGECHFVKQTGDDAVFIPTRTASEWNSFITNTPSGIQINSCAQLCTDIGGVLSGTQCTIIYSTPGSFTWNKPNGFEGVVSVEMWGAGGSGGNAYNGRQCSAGGNGGSYKSFTVNSLDLDSSVNVVVGSRGRGRSGNRPGVAGGNSLFDTMCASGGAGGRGQFFSTIYPPSCPSNTLPITIIRSETGATGGFAHQSGRSATYAGAGGGGMCNDLGGRSGGRSTYGGNGGAGRDGSGGDAASPGGGGGASDWDAGGPPGDGGNGRVVITFNLG